MRKLRVKVGNNALQNWGGTKVAFNVQIQQNRKKWIQCIIKLNKTESVITFTLNYFNDIHAWRDRLRIVPLQDPVTWYRINYTGTQITQWDFQNKRILTSPAWLFFVMKVPLRHLPPSVTYFIPCDRILQRAYSDHVF